MFFRLFGVLFRLNHKNVLSAGHLVYVLNAGIPSAGLTYQNSHHGGNSEVFSHINKDLILLSEILKQ